MFYGWRVVAAGFFIQALVNSLFTSAYGSYNLLLGREFGWSKTALSAGFSLVQAQSGVIGPAQGAATSRVGPRAVLRAGVILTGLGMIAFSRIGGLAGFYLSLLVIATGLSLAGYLTLTTAVVNWFRRRRSLALGLVSLGFAAGGLLARFTAAGLEAYGWRDMALWSGVAIIALGLVAAQFVRGHPSEVGLRIDGEEPEGGDQARTSLVTALEPDFRTGEAVRTRQFWFIAGGHGAALLIVATVQLQMVDHLATRLGYSLGQSAWVWMLLTFAQAAGMLSGGYLADRVSKRSIAAGCMFIHAGALLLLAFAAGAWMVVLFALGHGWAWGTRGPLMAAIRADYYGRRSYSAIMGISQPIIMIGMTGGPLLSGVLADLTGSYEAGFTVLAGLAGLGSIFFLLSTRPTPPRWG